jgi:hypothetical protein
VLGAYDLSLHNYGPERYVGSIHIEVDEEMGMARLDQLQREITYKVMQETGVLLEGIGIYCRNKKDSEADKLRKELSKYAKKFEFVKQIHGFYYDEAKQTVSFDLVITFDCKDRRKYFAEVSDIIRKEYPQYTFNINMDIDLSD